MKLLSTEQILTIKKAIKDVSDTFFLTDVKYHIAGDTLDRWGEDKNNREYGTITLKGLVEYSSDGSSDIKETAQGVEDNHEIVVTFNVEDLLALHLINPTVNKHVFNVAVDYITINSYMYKVTQIRYDGPFDELNCLLVIKARRDKYAALKYIMPVELNDVPEFEYFWYNIEW